MGKKQKRAGFSISSGSGFNDAARSNRSSSSTSSADPLPLPWLRSADKFPSASTLSRLSLVGCDTLSLPSSNEADDVGAQVDIATVAACGPTGPCRGASAGCSFPVPSSLPRRRSGPASCGGVRGVFSTCICVLSDVGDWGSAAPSQCVEEKRHCGAVRAFCPCPHDIVSCWHMCNGGRSVQCWTSAIGGYAGLLCTLCDKTAEAGE